MNDQTFNEDWAIQRGLDAHAQQHLSAIGRLASHPRTLGGTMTDVQDIAYHRNGVSGNGFHVVRFRTTEPGRRGYVKLVGFVFDEPGSVAVVDPDLLAQGVIAFGENSWRGDRYEKDLRAAIDAQYATA